MLRFHTTQANASISAAQEKGKILILVLALMLAFMLASLVKTRLNLGMVAEWKTRMSKKKLLTEAQCELHATITHTEREIRKIPHKLSKLIFF